jgi:hypothetical protein
MNYIQLSWGVGSLSEENTEAVAAYKETGLVSDEVWQGGFQIGPFEEVEMTEESIRADDQILVVKRQGCWHFRGMFFISAKVSFKTQQGLIQVTSSEWQAYPLLLKRGSMECPHCAHHKSALLCSNSHIALNPAAVRGGALPGQAQVFWAYCVKCTAHMAISSPRRILGIQYEEEPLIKTFLYYMMLMQDSDCLYIDGYSLEGEDLVQVEAAASALRELRGDEERPRPMWDEFDPCGTSFYNQKS